MAVRMPADASPDDSTGRLPLATVNWTGGQAFSISDEVVGERLAKGGAAQIPSRSSRLQLWVTPGCTSSDARFFLLAPGGRRLDGSALRSRIERDLGLTLPAADRKQPQTARKEAQQELMAEAGAAAGLAAAAPERGLKEPLKPTTPRGESAGARTEKSGPKPLPQSEPASTTPKATTPSVPEQPKAPDAAAQQDDNKQKKGKPKLVMAAAAVVIVVAVAVVALGDSSKQGSSGGSGHGQDRDDDTPVVVKTEPGPTVVALSENLSLSPDELRREFRSAGADKQTLEAGGERVFVLTGPSADVRGQPGATFFSNRTLHVRRGVTLISAAEWADLSSERLDRESNTITIRENAQWRQVVQRWASGSEAQPASIDRAEFLIRGTSDLRHAVCMPRGRIEWQPPKSAPGLARSIAGSGWTALAVPEGELATVMEARVSGVSLDRLFGPGSSPWRGGPRGVVGLHEAWKKARELALSTAGFEFVTVNLPSTDSPSANQLLLHRTPMLERQDLGVEIPSGAASISVSKAEMENIAGRLTPQSTATDGLKILKILVVTPVEGGRPSLAPLTIRLEDTPAPPTIAPTLTLSQDLLQKKPASGSRFSTLSLDLAGDPRSLLEAFSVTRAGPGADERPGDSWWTIRAGSGVPEATIWVLDHEAITRRVRDRGFIAIDVPADTSGGTAFQLVVHASDHALLTFAELSAQGVALANDSISHELEQQQWAWLQNRIGGESTSDSETVLIHEGQATSIRRVAFTRPQNAPGTIEVALAGALASNLTSEASWLDHPDSNRNARFLSLSGIPEGTKARVEVTAELIVANGKTIPLAARFQGSSFESSGKNLFSLISLDDLVRQARTEAWKAYSELARNGGEIPPAPAKIRLQADGEHEIIDSQGKLALSGAIDLDFPFAHVMHGQLRTWSTLGSEMAAVPLSSGSGSARLVSGLATSELSVQALKDLEQRALEQSAMLTAQGLSFPAISKAIGDFVSSQSGASQWGQLSTYLGSVVGPHLQGTAAMASAQDQQSSYESRLARVGAGSSSRVQLSMPGQLGTSGISSRLGSNAAAAEALSRSLHWIGLRLPIAGPGMEWDTDRHHWNAIRGGLPSLRVKTFLPGSRRRDLSDELAPTLASQPGQRASFESDRSKGFPHELAPSNFGGTSSNIRDAYGGAAEVALLTYGTMPRWVGVGGSTYDPFLGAGRDDAGTLGLRSTWAWLPKTWAWPGDSMTIDPAAPQETVYDLLRIRGNEAWTAWANGPEGSPGAAALGFRIALLIPWSAE